MISPPFFFKYFHIHPTLIRITQFFCIPDFVIKFPVLNSFRSKKIILLGKTFEKTTSLIFYNFQIEKRILSTISEESCFSWNVKTITWCMFLPHFLSWKKNFWRRQFWGQWVEKWEFGSCFFNVDNICYCLFLEKYFLHKI